jgi:hypothetical protein
MEKWFASLAESWIFAHTSDVAAWAVDRLREPSTWASIAVWITAQAHILGNPDGKSAFVSFGVSFAALLGVILKEKGVTK